MHHGLKSAAFWTCRAWVLVLLTQCCMGATIGVCVGEAGEPDLYRAADGRIVTLAPPAKGLTTLVFYSTECPISNYYSATLNALFESQDQARARLIGVCVDPDVTIEQQARHAREYDLKFPVIRDPRGALARKLGVKVTPEAVVLDGDGRVRYRGRIDDQYLGRRQKNAAPRTHNLKDALIALLDDRAVTCSEVEAVGCPLPEVGAETGDPVTYAGVVGPLIQRHCQGCHRPGQIGPFALETYEQARKRAADLAAVVSNRTMPPWLADSAFGGPFQHDRSLSTEEVAAFVTWADQGAPAGNLDELPPAPRFADEWTLGTPDLIIEMAEDFEVPATGSDIYRCFVIPTDLPEDVYVSGLDYKPGNARVVHHILGYVDTTGEALRKDREEPGQGYTCFGGPRIDIHGDLGGWAPGVEASALPEGIGRALPKGAVVVLQVHYHPSGKVERDRSRVGLYFAKQPVKQTFHWAAVLNTKFELDPERPETWEVEASWTAPIDLQAYACAPHMHLLGQDMTMAAELPDGSTVPLIRINAWDFQWQHQYYLEHPINLPAGSKVRVRAHFDYSRSNPNNVFRDQSPMPVVKWGEATTDEMCIGFLGVVKAGQDLTEPGEPDDLRDILERSYQDR